MVDWAIEGLKTASGASGVDVDHRLWDGDDMDNTFDHEEETEFGDEEEEEILGEGVCFVYFLVIFSFLISRQGLFSVTFTKLNKAVRCTADQKNRSVLFLLDKIASLKPSC